jgi:hypothetical protein
MTESVTNQTGQQDLLTRVREGMDVFDREGHKVGRVEDVYVGDAADAPAPGRGPAEDNAPLAPGAGSLVGDVARVFSDNMPDVLRNRLRHNGFIRVSGGLLQGNRFALREQVAAVEGERVVLNVARNELINP